MLNQPQFDESELDEIEEYLRENDVDPLDDETARRMAAQLMSRLYAVAPGTRTITAKAPTETGVGWMRQRAVAALGYVAAAAAILICICTHLRQHQLTSGSDIVGGNPHRLRLDDGPPPRPQLPPVNPSETEADPTLIPPQVSTPAPLSKPDLYTYRIKAGDTLGAIALEYYGAASEWRQILDANPGLDPESMRIGREIYIPPRRVVLAQRQGESS